MLQTLFVALSFSLLDLLKTARQLSRYRPKDSKLFVGDKSIICELFYHRSIKLPIETSKLVVSFFFTQTVPLVSDSTLMQ